MDDDESELGKKDYWEDAYTEELQNFIAFGDEGEIWFGESVFETLMEWLVELVHSHFNDASSGHVLDVGCGNGHFLMELYVRGFHALTGTDYSENSIALCRKIVQAKEMDAINLQVDDILDSKLTESFDLILDKGTFDAISLSSGGKLKRVRYIESVDRLLNVQGLLVITSCNFTVEELREDFRQRFCYVDHVKDYTRLSFGGSEGTTVSTVAFKKNVPHSSHH